MAGIPGKTQVVIVGGGIVGCNVAYHLTLQRIADVVLAEFVVNAGGIGAHGLEAGVSAAIPLHAAKHVYIVMEPMPDLPKHLPAPCDGDACINFKEDAGKLLAGRSNPLPSRGESAESPNAFPLNFCRKVLSTARRAGGGDPPNASSGQHRHSDLFQRTGEL